MPVERSKLPLGYYARLLNLIAPAKRVSSHELMED